MRSKITLKLGPSLMFISQKDFMQDRPVAQGGGGWSGRSTDPPSQVEVVHFWPW